MAESYKVLGQAAPAAATPTSLYTSPSGGTAAGTVVSSIAVCNQNATGQAKFRVAVRPAGAALASVHYLYYDAYLAGGSTFIATIGVTLAPTDVVTVQTDTTNVSFHAYGTELS